MEDRILVLAPRGRDAAIACDLLHRHGINAHICAGLADLVAEIDRGAGAVLLTEEALAGADRGALTAWVATQPTWSDLSFVVLANGGAAPRTALATERLGDLANIVLLQRPLHAEAMIGAVRSALKARRRQYEIRAAAETLERSVIERTRELEAARESLQIALDAAEMGSWDLDLVTGDARRTLRHDQIFGYAELQDRWSRDQFLSHVAESERAGVAAAFDAALTDGSLDIECRIEGVDGRSRWIIAKGKVRYDAAGRPVRMTGVV